MLNERYYSHLRSVVIPLYGFKHFHYANNNESDTEDFIGRSSIVDKLSAWLTDTNKKNYSGAYLVTGYRGMGKSSFVYEAIKKTKNAPTKGLQIKYITVPINVGNELLSAKELLGMMCKVGYEKYEEATKGVNWIIQRLNTLFGIAIVICLIVVAMSFLDCKRANVESCIAIDNYIRLILNTTFLIGYVLLILSSGYIANFLMYSLWMVTGWGCFITSRQIRQSWKKLLERIDAELFLSSELGLSKEDVAKEFIKGLQANVGFKKELKYPIAGVPEMQEMMVKLLDLINRSPLIKLRFIFVVDELDKISPKDDEKPIMPEYDVFSDDKAVTMVKSRQNALASLMANMKYFISSSKAKFVFVTGYDMYDAKLADISNREFNIHSIFCGHINVSSFFRHTEKYSGVDSMIEEYLCHMLMEDEDGKTEKIKTLKDYVKYVKSEWKCSHKITIEEYQSILDRRIVFLRCFLTYLIYMSNGSPKKLAMYIEKFIRTKEKMSSKLDSEKSQFGNNDRVNLGMPSCEYYMYFDNRNVQRICFVHYLIYPMIQSLVDKSNIYNDKLLVSTSFMLSNLYKFHKSGFSMRNLEYMPELLDINKMPELRDFIGGIVNFLTQTHIDEASINLYKYKFPLRLSEEITFYSKSSEEISYLFNFSHDELLSVKKLYMRQIKHYMQQSNVEPMAIASLHHTLGDIYMLEENYEQAIYEFQEALSSLLRQDKGSCFKNFGHSQQLFFIRLSLKLGLAYEKRKTYDTAYLEYEHLTKLILDSVSKMKLSKVKSVVSPKEDFPSLHNIRIMYLAPLAKFHILEKMDLGGYTEEDLNQLLAEIKILLKNPYIRSITQIDFYTKLGDIMYYRNEKGKSVNSLFWYSKSLSILADEFFGKERIIETKKRQCYSLSFLEVFLKKEQTFIFFNKGTALVNKLVNAMEGLANGYLGIISKKPTSASELEKFFSILNVLSSTKVSSEVSKKVDEIDNTLSFFMRSILFYWNCALLYESIDEYKSAHSIYVQMLESIRIVYETEKYKVEKEMLEFCSYITRKSIQNSYKHYRHINIAEIDKLKGILNENTPSNINLDYLSNFPDIETVVYQYYKICFLSDDESFVVGILRNVVNARQLGGRKIISSVTHDIINLCFKERLNEQILFILMPELKRAFNLEPFNIYSAITAIDSYLQRHDCEEEVINKLDWHIFDPNTSVEDRHFLLLQYLVSDSLFCLNKITDILTPLYCTTLYNNFYIGECYEKGYIWNIIRLAIKEIINSTKYDSIDYFVNKFISLYHIECTELKEKFERIKCFLEKSYLYHLSDTEKDLAIESMYAKISPSGYRYLTSSYLLGNALDYYHKAFDMHNGRKAYKEMMTTLYFLEDDLHNDSCYFNFATEMYCVNARKVENHIEHLKKLYDNSKSLFTVDNYVNE